MSDTSHRGKVVFLAATNRPDLMDSAMKRAGRFDKKIPFFPPDTDAEREAIFKALLTKYGIVYEIKDFTQACQITDGYSGADLEAIIIKAVEISRDSHRETVTDIDLTLAAKSILPSAAEDVAFMTDLALKECNDITLVPSKYLDRVKALRTDQHDPEIAPCPSSLIGSIDSPFSSHHPLQGGAIPYAKEQRIDPTPRSRPRHHQEPRPDRDHTADPNRNHSPDPPADDRSRYRREQN